LGDYIDEIEAAEERKSDAESRKDAFESGDPPGAEPVEEDWADEDTDRYDKYLCGRVKELKAEMKGDTAQAAAYQEQIRACEKQQTQYKQIKAEIKEAKQKAKDLRSQLLDRMDDARDALTPDEEADLVLTVARTELADELEGYVDAHRQRVVAAFENWWDKYHTTMQDIKGRREETTEKLSNYLEVMGYE
jgi:type I restriction enzyme M protein